MTHALPAGFELLEPFVKDWALATQIERETKRRAASGEELRAFFKAAFPETPRSDHETWRGLPPSKG